MVDVLSYSIISLTCFCFGLIVSFQVAHIHYCRKLTTLVRRSWQSTKCSNPKNKTIFRIFTPSKLVNTRLANN